MENQMVLLMERAFVFMKNEYLLIKNNLYE